MLIIVHERKFLKRLIFCSDDNDFTALQEASRLRTITKYTNTIVFSSRPTQVKKTFCLKDGGMKGQGHWKRSVCALAEGHICGIIVKVPTFGFVHSNERVPDTEGLK